MELAINTIIKFAIVILVVLVVILIAGTLLKGVTAPFLQNFVIK